MNKRIFIIIGLMLASSLMFAQNHEKIEKVKQNVKKEFRKDSQAVKETSVKVWKSTKVEATKAADQTGKYTRKIEKKVRKEAPVKWDEVKKGVTKESKEVSKKVKEAGKKLKSDLHKKHQ